MSVCPPPTGGAQVLAELARRRSTINPCCLGLWLWNGRLSSPDALPHQMHRTGGCIMPSCWANAGGLADALVN